MDDQILSLEHISLSYHTMKGETPALCDLTFSVNPGEFVALMTGFDHPFFASSSIAAERPPV